VLIELLFIMLSFVFCVPSSQIILDWLDDNTDILCSFDFFGAGDLIDWFREVDGFGTTCAGIVYLFMSMCLYVVSPISHAIQTAFTVSWLLISTHRINSKMNKLNEVIKTGKQKCHKHPEVTLAICLELDGTVHTICCECDPKKAASYGITKGENGQDK
jgi:hypothetical protein